MLRKTLFLCAVTVLLAPLPAQAGGEKNPKEKRNRLDTRGAIHGSGFRITIIHPFRGDFSEYDKLEVVRTTSDVGDAVPDKAMEDYTKHLDLSFQKSGTFKEVREVDKVQLAQEPSRSAPDPGEVPDPDSPGLVEGSSSPSDVWTAFLSEPFKSSPPPVPNLAGPIRLHTPPPNPSTPLPATQGASAKRTMVIASSVIYYQKGNRTLRAVGFGGGYFRFVVRFYIYDKELGVELAMGNISGEVNTSFYAVPFLAGDSEGRESVVSALVNRVEVRKASADQ